MQRHHSLPRQLLSGKGFARFFGAVSLERIGFDDFRANGLLLPASEAVSVRMGLPLHRGPHRNYNEMVFERVGQIEGEWALTRAKAPEIAVESALMRLELLQAALRRRLLDPPGRRVKLNSKDPLGTGFDFTELDAMAERLWADTAPALDD